MKHRGVLFAILAIAVVGSVFAAFTGYESYTSLYDAEYVGNEACVRCHGGIFEEWRTSPHALMTRPAASSSVVGDFDNAEWYVPASFDPENPPLDAAEYAPSASGADSDADSDSGLDSRPDSAEAVQATPAARMYESDGTYYMSILDPETGRHQPFPIDYVIGFQYRQVYLTQEPGGVLRRLPLQWSVYRQTFFPYWNLQEGSEASVPDLWAQMRSQNSAWNMFCARCHVTNLEVHDFAFADHHFSEAETEWTDPGIGCEACHGPGSHHVSYFDRNYINRLVAFVNSKLRRQPVAYIAYGPKLTRGQDLSTCARCHGPDIMLANTDVYRTYEPGYSREGRINDLSPHFKEMPLQPGRTDPTVECWEDGRPKGIGMLFRSFIESACYENAEVRCYNCHDPHQNKFAQKPGLLAPSAVSDAYCLECHGEFAGRIREHTFHEPGTPGSHCYDCHMPRNIHNLVGGYLKLTRTHQMSSIPRPDRTLEMGREHSPNACDDCHGEEDPEWAVEWSARWWGSSATWNATDGSE